MDPLKNLYKDKLSNYSIDEDNGEWMELDKKLNRVEFYTFNILKFNIYYAIAIFITSIAVLFLLFSHNLFVQQDYRKEGMKDNGASYDSVTDYKQKKKNAQSPNFSIIVGSNKNSTTKNIPHTNRGKDAKFHTTKDTSFENNQTALPIKKNEKSGYKNKVIKNDSIAESKNYPLTTKNIDSSSIVNVEQPKFPPNPAADSLSGSRKVVRKKVIHKVYQSKRDTIFEIDSVKIKSKRKK